MSLSVKATRLKDIRKEYDRYRSRYYQDYKLPRSKEILIVWGKTPGLLGNTVRIKTRLGYLYTLTLSRTLYRQPRLLCLTLLHEMSHIANWRPSCKGRSRAWDKEAIRLGQLGALKEIF